MDRTLNVCAIQIEGDFGSTKRAAQFSAKINMLLSQRAALLAGLLLVGAKPAGKLGRVRIQLAETLAVRIARASLPARQILGDGVE